MGDQKVRVGIIGAGIGRQHLRGYAGVANAQVTAICDLDWARAQKMATDAGLESALIFSSYREMLRAQVVDAVSICLPNFLHLESALACFQNGVHVLCEKPLALDARQARQMAEAARAANRVCMVGQVLRFRDDIVALKERAAQIGEIYYGRALARRCYGIPKWGGWFTRREFSGGGPLIDTGVHLIDLAWWLAGCPPPLSASAVFSDKFGPHKLHLGAGGAAREDGIFDVEDLAAGFVRFQNGFSLHFEASWAIKAEHDERFCHLHGTRGALLWNNEPKIISADGVVEALPSGAGDAFAKEAAHFIRCVQTGAKPDPDADQGVVILQILDALARSARENREVPI